MKNSPVKSRSIHAGKEGVQWLKTHTRNDTQQVCSAQFVLL